MKDRIKVRFCLFAFGRVLTVLILSRVPTKLHAEGSQMISQKEVFRRRLRDCWSVACTFRVVRVSSERAVKGKDSITPNVFIKRSRIYIALYSEVIVLHVLPDRCRCGLRETG